MRIFDKFLNRKKESAIVDIVVAGFQAFNPWTFVISFALSMIVSRIFYKKPPKQVDNGVRQQIPPATTNSFPIVYGDAYLGGMFVDAVLSKNAKRMYYVLGVSSISDNGQFIYNTSEFYYGDRKITFDTTDQTRVVSLTDQAGNVTTKIDNDLWIYLYTSNAAGVITPVNTALMPHQVMKASSQTITVIVYKQSSTVPSAPSGTSTFTWSSKTFTPTPAGWTKTYPTFPSSPVYSAKVTISGTGTTSTINWSTATVAVATQINGIYPNTSNYSTGSGVDCPNGLEWPATNRQMNSIAFAIAAIDYNSDDGITSLDPITFYCSQYLNSQGCAKPGDVWKDYLANVYYGGAVDPDLINTASATALNAYADELIPYTPVGGGTATQPRYRINGVLDTGQNVLSNINKILEACDSWMAYNAALGQWAVIVNQAQASAFSFNDDNIVDDIRVSTVDLNQSPNQIEAKFPNKLNKDVADFVYIKTPTELLFANEPVNKLSIDLDMVNNNIQAQYLANRILEQAREDLMVTIKTTYEGIQVNAGDVVDVTNTAYGWNNKMFRVMKVNETANQDGMLNALLELSEYNAQVYDNQTILEFTPSPNSNISYIGFFGDLNQPYVTDQLPNAAVPSFSVGLVLPVDGQINKIYLYYTTVTNPVSADWNLWNVEESSNSAPFPNDTLIKFGNINLPTAIYYFAYKVSNLVGTSPLSPISAAYDWLPNPSSSSVAGTFIAQFSPNTLAVPFNVTPSFTGIAPQLYGTTAGGSVDFIPAQTDSDVLFVNNSWRIGGSSTTGYADIVSSGITIGNPTDGGFFAAFPTPTAMPSNPATISVPVRYKATDGTVYQGATAIQQLTYAIQGATGSAGASGNQTGTANLYQWATATPANPNGTSTFVWATATNTSYSGGNGWTTTIPANPGTPSIKLWSASKGVVDVGTATNTTVSWASGFSVQDISENGATGASGTQSANAIVYQWAATIPSSPTGTSTYTWASGTFTPTPSAWTLSPSTSPSSGFTLWAASVRLIASATQSTSSINWTTATISAVGYAGEAGASSRLAFARVASNPAPISGNVTTIGSSSYPTSSQSNSVWGFSATWEESDPDPTSIDSLYQSDGIYSPSTGNTVWGTPYISSLKVGSLSAITVNTGGLIVTDFIKAGSSPAISGTSMTGTGFTLNSAGTFAIGNSTKNLSFNGSTLTMNGDLVVTGNIQNDAINQFAYGELGQVYSGKVNSYTASEVYTLTLPQAYSPKPTVIFDSNALINSASNGNYYITADIFYRKVTPTWAAGQTNYFKTTGAGVNGIFNCLVATTANITLSGVQTIDGVLLETQQRVLVKNQTTASQNGIYVVDSGAWYRPSDYATWAGLYQSSAFVQSGTINANTIYDCSIGSSGTIGSTNVTYVLYDKTTHAANNECSFTFDIAALNVYQFTLGKNASFPIKFIANSNNAFENIFNSAGTYQAIIILRYVAGVSGFAGIWSSTQPSSFLQVVKK